MKKIIVVNNPSTWDIVIDGVEVISSKEYLTNSQYANLKNIRIFNLCRSYTYQSKGYYVSLLAEARSHKPIPDVKELLDIQKPSIVRLISQDMDELIQKSLRDIKSDEFILSVYFGQNLAKKYSDLSMSLFRHFNVPFLRVKFTLDKRWIIQNIITISEKDIPEQHFDFMKHSAVDYFSKKRYGRPKKLLARYSMAIMIKDGDEAPPSNSKAISKLIELAEKQGFEVDIISPRDYNRLPEYDALFIRQNTHVNNETYRFARRAQSEGIALIDYPDSILKCNNKVYLAELLNSAGIPTPATMIIHRGNIDMIESTLSLPCVLKLPDSTFSFGVKKADTRTELKELLDSMLKKSELLIAQQYCYTEFDWRIGIIDGEPFFACKYMMARDHWQIYNWSAKKEKDNAGGFESFLISDVPLEVVNLAVKSVKLIGLGLYGVDIKVIDGRPIVIEINENPNIDSGIEDLAEGDVVYLKIIDAFKKRLTK